VIGFLAFSVRRGWQGFWRNAVMSIAATITMMLMLLLLAGLVIGLSGLQAGLRFVEQKVEIQAFIADGTPKDRIDALAAQVGAQPEVASVTYVDKETALTEWREQLREQGRTDYTTATGTNPIPASLRVKLRDPRVYGDVVETLQASTGVVTDVLETQRVVDALLGVTGFMRTAGIIVMLLVGVTVLFIVTLVTLVAIGHSPLVSPPIDASIVGPAPPPLQPARRSARNPLAPFDGDADLERHLAAYPEFCARRHGRGRHAEPPV